MTTEHSDGRTMTPETVSDDPVLRLVREAHGSVPPDLLSPTGAQATVVFERVMRTRSPDALPGGSPRLSRARWISRPVLTVRRRAALGLAIAGAAAAVTLGISGVLPGESSTGVAPAAAAVLRGAAAVLEGQNGTIVDEAMRSVQTSPGRPPLVFAQHMIIETPTSGPQNTLTINSSSPGNATGAEVATVKGEVALYDPAGNTIYETSHPGLTITQGPVPGTYLARVNLTAPAGSYAYQIEKLPPIQITAAQAKALRDGSEQLSAAGGPPRAHLVILPTPRFATQTALVLSRLKAGTLKVTGPTTVDGRPAIELACTDGTCVYDVQPRTYNPIKYQITDHGTMVTTTYSLYEVRPVTPASERLLSMTARHPGATLDEDPGHFAAAQARLFGGI
jgi:hypothetical protein